jgi:hypothetical protein
LEYKADKTVPRHNCDENETEHVSKNGKWRIVRDKINK